jgi:ribonuclease Z
MHGDHYFGLPGLINSMSLLGRIAPLHLHGPAALMPILDSILQSATTTLCYPLHFHPLPEGVALITDTPTFSVHCFPVSHGIACSGFLIEMKTRGRRILPEKCEEFGIPSGYFDQLKMGSDFEAPDGTLVKNEWVTADGPAPKKYAYCTDTLCTDSFLPVIHGADMIYHESTYLHADAEKAAARFHSTSVQAAQQATKANAKQLLLGHFSSKYKELDAFKEEAEPHFPGVIVSVEGVAYDV